MDSKTLGEALPLEMARVRDDVMPAYQEIGAAGMCAVFGTCDARLEAAGVRLCGEVVRE